MKYANNLDLVIPIQNLLEYHSDYSDIRGGLWFYSKDEAARLNSYIVSTEFFFKYKAILLGDTDADGAYQILRSTTIAVSLKY